MYAWTRKVALPLTILLVTASTLTASDAILTSEWIYEQAPFPECHASTIADTDRGLIVAWFGGSYEKHPDVGIWIARQEQNAWSTPREVVNGIASDGQRFPCWNPVLFQAGEHGLLLFYKVGPSPENWWGMRTVSHDGGQTWSKSVRLPEKILGPIKNKPVMLADGRLLCGSSTEHDGWKVHLEMTPDLGATWSRTDSLPSEDAPGAIQPTILVHSRDGSEALQILCRARGGGRLLESWSRDAGQTWSALKPTPLPNPNSGIDGVTLRDGRHLLVYNHTPRGRSPLNVAWSPDGKHWHAAAILESQPGEYSYPAVIQAADGKVHITYTWKRKRIRHVVLDPERLEPRPIVDGRWPE